jgi:hypothetical protein
MDAWESVPLPLGVRDWIRNFDDEKYEEFNQNT